MKYLKSHIARTIISGALMFVFGGLSNYFAWAEAVMEVFVVIFALHVAIWALMGIKSMFK